MPSNAVPLPRHLIPLPDRLEGVASVIRCWVRTKPTIQRALLFGSTLHGAPSPRDLDIAIQYTMTDQEEVFEALRHDVTPWRAYLSKITGLQVDLQVAHPELTDQLWGYLEADGCALIFERTGMFKNPTGAPA